MVVLLMDTDIAFYTARMAAGSVIMMKRLIFVLILAPLIRANYWLRARGLVKDMWFYPDLLAFTWGYTVTLSKTDRTIRCYRDIRCFK